MKPFTKNILGCAFGFTLAMVAVGTSYAQVVITKGKTPIPDGNAISDGDITVQNDKLAFAIAVESPPPWGVARGTIVDIANVLPDGSLSNDRVAFAGFIPNNWSSWPTTYKDVKIIKDTPEEAVISSVRDFGKITITSIYTLKAGSDIIDVKTTMKNGGKAVPDMLSGFTLWQDGGYKFAVPGHPDKDVSNVTNPMADRYIGYNESWSIALHAPYFNEIRYGSRDLYAKHTLAENGEISFQGHYQVISSGDVSGVVRAEIARKNLDYGTLAGSVKDNRKKKVAQPAVVVIKDDVPYIWVIGKDGQYSIDLPVGDYQVYATSKGYSNSETQKISIGKGATTETSFAGLGASGKLNITISDNASAKPLDAKIQIEEGSSPLIEFLGAKTFYTSVTPTGQAIFDIAPGQYKLKISHGDNFLAAADIVDIEVVSGKTKKIKSKLDFLTEPITQGWYSGDLHHHANVLEGTTPPEYVVRAQLAAGLGVTFLSDHDSNINHAEMQKLSDERDVTFIPSIELSPSWGHFNPFPINLGAELTVDPGVDDVHTLFKYARDNGATVISVNHPYIEYGYFRSLGNKVAPGGLNSTFDLLELNSGTKYQTTVDKAYDFWNRGLAYYFSAGSDAHDAWNDDTGDARMFVYTGKNGRPTSLEFAQAMKDGHAYASFGPVIYPKNVMFGDTLKTYKEGKQVVSFDLFAVNQLKSVQLVGNAGVIKEVALSGTKASVEFDIPNKDGWVALVVTDGNDQKAFSNPIWVKNLEVTSITEVKK